jgi:hypothetical protein
MYYLENIRTLIKLFKELEEEVSDFDIAYKYNHMLWKWERNSRQLEVYNDGYSMKMNRSFNHYMERNYIAITSKRAYITNNNTDFRTTLYVTGGTNMTVSTEDLLTEEGYFQYSLLAELSTDIEEIQQVYQAMTECIENGISFNGSYRGKLLNPIPLVRKIVNEGGDFEYWSNLYAGL